MTLQTAIRPWPPRYLCPVPPDGLTRGRDAIEFIEGYGRIVRDSIGGPVGERLHLRDWQRSLINGLLTVRQDDKLQYRTALVGMPRKNGKSALISGLALWALYCGPDGGEIYSVAGDREQARITFGTARRMVEMDPELLGLAKLYRDAIELPKTGSTWRVVSSDAPLKEGLSPTFTVVDEVHVIDEELWNVFALAMGARPEPLMIGVTTAGVRAGTNGQDSLCYRMYQHGQRVASGEVDDPTFFFAWWEAAKDAPHDDPDTWASCNPGYADLVAADDFSSSVLRVPEAEFRTKRLNQFVNSARSWLPNGAWEAAKAERVVSPTEAVVLGADLAWTNDSVAIVGCTVADRHLFVVASWERPLDDRHWRVDSAEVDLALREACAKYNVVEIAADPYEWRAQLAAWESDGLPISEWPTSSIARMVPACKEFYAAVMEKTLSHDGDARLARHLSNAVVKEDRYGLRITKERASSPRKIDLAVAAVISYDRACYHEPVEKPPAVRFFSLD